MQQKVSLESQNNIKSQESSSIKSTVSPDQSIQLSISSSSTKKKQRKKLTVAVNAAEAIMYIDSIIQKKKQNRRKSGIKECEQNPNLLSIPTQSNEKMTLNDLKVFFSHSNIKDSQSDSLQDYIVQKIQQIIKKELPTFQDGQAYRRGNSISSTADLQNSEIEITNEENLQPSRKSKSDIYAKNKQSVFQLQIIKLFEAINKKNQDEIIKSEKDNQQTNILSNSCNGYSLDKNGDITNQETDSENGQESDKISSDSMNQNVPIGIQIGFLDKDKDYDDESQSKTGTVSIILEDEQKTAEDGPLQTEHSFSYKSQKSEPNADEDILEIQNEKNLFIKSYEKDNPKKLIDSNKLTENLKNIFKEQIANKLSQNQTQLVQIQNNLLDDSGEHLGQTETLKLKDQSLPQASSQFQIAQDTNLVNSNQGINTARKMIQNSKISQIQDHEISLSQKLSSISKKDSQKQKTEQRVQKDKPTIRSHRKESQQFERAQSEKNIFQNQNFKGTQNIQQHSEKALNSQENRKGQSFQGNSEDTKRIKRKAKQLSDHSKYRIDHQNKKRRFLSSLYKIQHLVKNIYCTLNIRESTALETKQFFQKNQIDSPSKLNEKQHNKVWQRMLKLINLKNLMSVQEETNLDIDNQQTLEKAIEMSYSTILEDLREYDLSSFTPKKEDISQENSDFSQIISPDNKSGKSQLIFTSKKERETPQPFMNSEPQSLNEKKQYLRQMTQKMNKTDKNSVSEVFLSQSSSVSMKFIPGSENGKEGLSSIKNKNKRKVIQVGFLAGLNDKQGSSDNMNQNFQSSSSNKIAQDLREQDPRKGATLTACKSNNLDISKNNKST